MPPIGDDASHVAPSPTGSDVIGNEAAAPVSDTPSPPDSPSPPPPPPPPQLHQPLPEDEPYLRELHPFVPYAPYPGDPGDCLPLNTNLPRVLMQVSGKEDLNEVFDLKLRVIARDMSLQRLCCLVPNLRELSLDGSCLVSLRDLGCGLIHLEVLRIARCGLDSLDGLLGLVSLKELHAAGNLVADISPLIVLPDVRLIDLRANLLSDITYVTFLSFCKSLEHLILAECPAANCKGYREEVRRFLPMLITLDGEPMQPYDTGSDINLQDDTDDEDDFGGDGIDDWLSGDVSQGSSGPTSGQGHQEQVSLGQAAAGAKEGRTENCSSQKKAFHVARSAGDAVRLPQRCSSAYVKSGATHEQKDVRCMSAMGGMLEHGTGDGGGSGGGVTDHGHDDAPSRLTSGPPLCGDVATSLRRLRKLKPWTIASRPDQTKQLPMGLCSEIAADDVDKASRRLHELYQTMRDEFSAESHLADLDETSSVEVDQH